MDTFTPETMVEREPAAEPTPVEPPEDAESEATELPEPTGTRVAQL